MEIEANEETLETLRAMEVSAKSEETFAQGDVNTARQAAQKAQAELVAAEEFLTRHAKGLDLIQDLIRALEDYLGEGDATP